MSKLPNSCSTLSQIHTGEDIQFLSPAITPGAHCPLFGVVMCEPFIQDLAVMILGDGECCWNAYHHHMSQGGGNHFYTYSMDDMDVIYGCSRGLTEAVQQVYREDHFKALMLVSSCVPELTGEDLEKLAEDCELPVPVLCAHTSHYNSTGYIQGISSFYSALYPLITPSDRPREGVAILGSRYANTEKSEIPAKIAAAGQRVFLPGSVEDIRSLSSVRLNLVLDVTALAFARKARELYGIPYVRADRLLNPERLLDVYVQIDKILGTNLREEAHQRCEAMKHRMADLREFFGGKTFLCAAPFCRPFETSEFFCRMGMEPVFIVARDIYEGDREDMDKLLKRGIDCPVTTYASMGNLETHYRDLHADLYFGFMVKSSLPKNSLLINPAPFGAMTGFAFPEWILGKMEAYREGGSNGT